MQAKAFENTHSFTTVCIDACEGHILRGRLYNPCWSGAVPFHGLMQFFLCMEQLLDTASAQQGEAPLRVLILDDALEQQSHGKCATFIIKILFRQNAGWQGSVLWVEKGQEESFRSELELSLLMDSALNQTESPS